MPVYKLEYQGKTYTVEADTDEDAMQAVEESAQDSKPSFNMRDVIAAGAEQDREQREAIASSVPEIGRRIKGGAKQVGAALSDMYNLAVKGKPYRQTAERRAPDGRLLSREVDYADTSKFKQVTIEEAARQKISDLEAAEAGINPKLRDVSASVGEMAALGVASEAGIARGATTLTGNLIRQAAAGGAQSAFQFDAGDGKGVDVLIGATGSAALGTLTGLAGAVKNVVARGLQKAASARTGAAVANASSVLPQFNDTVTLAQRTGIPELKTLEQAAYNSTMQKAYADQTDKFIEDISTVLNQPLAPGQNIDTDFIRARGVAEANLKALRENTRNGWEQGMNQVKALTPKTGPKNVPAASVVDQFEQERDNFRNVLKNLSGSKVNARTLRTLETVLTPQNKIINPRSRGLDIDQFADLLQGLTTLERETSDPVVKGFATRMRLAMDKDVQNLANYNGPALPAVSELLQTRLEYQRGKMAQKLMQDSVTYKLLGVGQKKGAPIPTSDELVSNFQSFSPEKQRELRIWAQQHSPEILKTMRQKTISDAVRNAKTIGPAADSQQSLEQLTDALFDQKRGFDLRSSGLWDNVDQAKFEGIRDGLRVIANQRANGVRGAGTPIKSEDIAINLISRSGPFLARQLSRVAFGSKAADFFTDPQVYKLLTKVRKLSGPSQLAARTSLMELLQTEYDASPYAEEINQEVNNQRQPALAGR